MPKQPGKLRNKSTKQVQDLLRHHGFEKCKDGPHEHWIKHSADVGLVMVPANRKAIVPKTLASILEQAGITKSEARLFWSGRRKNKVG